MVVKLQEMYLPWSLRKQLIPVVLSRNLTLWPFRSLSIEASYLYALRKKASYNSWGTGKPCALEIGKIVSGSEAHERIQQMLPSNDVIGSHIQDTSHNLLLQVVQDIKSSCLEVSVQLEESIDDVNNCSQLLAIVRYLRIFILWAAGIDGKGNWSFQSH